MIRLACAYRRVPHLPTEGNLLGAPFGQTIQRRPCCRVSVDFSDRFHNSSSCHKGALCLPGAFSMVSNNFRREADLVKCWTFSINCFRFSALGKSAVSTCFSASCLS